MGMDCEICGEILICLITFKSTDEELLFAVVVVAVVVGVDNSVGTVMTLFAFAALLILLVLSSLASPLCGLGDICFASNWIIFKLLSVGALSTLSMPNLVSLGLLSTSVFASVATVSSEISMELSLAPPAATVPAAFGIGISPRLISLMSFALSDICSMLSVLSITITPVLSIVNVSLLLLLIELPLLVGWPADVPAPSSFLSNSSCNTCDRFRLSFTNSANRLVSDILLLKSILRADGERRADDDDDSP